MYTYCLILRWDSFKQGQWVFTSYIENNERLLHILCLGFIFLVYKFEKKILEKKKFLRLGCLDGITVSTITKALILTLKISTSQVGASDDDACNHNGIIQSTLSPTPDLRHHLYTL